MLIPEKQSAPTFVGAHFVCGRSPLAEKEGFEPSRPVKAYMISNHAPSTN